MSNLLVKISLSHIILCATISGAAATEKEKPSRPNILFCIADDATFYHFSKAGCEWINTPNFDRIANDGVFFKNCYTPNAKSAPSRACILTGRNSWMLNEGANHVNNFPAEFKVFTEVLTENGYTVGYTGKGWAPGNPGEVNGKPRILIGDEYQNKKLISPTNQISDNDYSANFADFLLQAKQNNDKPWFFWLGSQEPHREYVYGSGTSLGNKKLCDIDNVPAFLPDCDSVRNDMLDYAFEIEWLDKQLGKVLFELEKSGELENTVVVFTSDNGMPFPRCKANNYEFSHHMPLAIMWPAGIKKRGRVVDDYISHTDFAPTFLELAEIDFIKSGMSDFAGKSFKSILESSKTGMVTNNRGSMVVGRERDDYGRPGNQGYPIRGIMRNGMLYLKNFKSHLYPAGNPETGYMDIDGSPTKTIILNMNRDARNSYYYQLSMGIRMTEELYDLRKDSYCINNLSHSLKYEKIKDFMRNELLDILKTQQDPRIVGSDPNIFDKYPYDNQELKWNFYERFMNGEIKEPWKFTKWINPTDYEVFKK